MSNFERILCVLMGVAALALMIAALIHQVR